MELSNSVLPALEPQVLLAFTDKFPEVNELPKATVIEVVPCPLLIVAPVGAVQV